MSSHNYHQQALWILTTPDQIKHHICRVPRLMSSDALPPERGEEELAGETVERIGSVDVFVRGLRDGACTRVNLHDVRMIRSDKPNYLVIPKERFVIIGQEGDETNGFHVQLVDDSNQTIRCTAFKMPGSDSEFAVELCHRQDCKKQGKGHVSRVEVGVRAEEASESTAPITGRGQGQAQHQLSASL